jgi:phosphatidylserine/phosphatidylglycerophosphate/cardiolipin synthase-like enzyme
MRTVLTLLAALALGACALERAPRRADIERAEAMRPTALECAGCAEETPLAELAERSASESTPDAPVHFVSLLEDGAGALALRLNLVRAARESIELQTFILEDDDAGRLVLAELLRAAKRGVRVRILSDQLFSVGDKRLLAALATAHANLELKSFNPAFGKASTQPAEFAAGILCCFLRFNQRMHQKLLLVDGRYGITGGRNVDNRYYDLSTTFNYRDRDVLLVGPETRAMAHGFEQHWRHDGSVPAAGLRDVASALDDARGLDLAARLAEVGADAATIAARGRDPAYVRREFVDTAFRVGRVEYFADHPSKLFGEPDPDARDVSERLAVLIEGASERVTLETPYLVLSHRARAAFQKLRDERPQVRVRVQTNSLAATDAFYVYAISYKYKRRYLSRYKFQLHEYKPFPADYAAAPVDPESGRIRRRQPIPLARPGVRRGLHAKAIVLDGAIAVIGTHNFDPRSDRLNTESGLIVWDAPFAQALEQSIERDMAPGNSWLVARRPPRDTIGRVGAGIGKISESLPLFDLWPFRYATSYELKPDCPEPILPARPRSEEFQRCYEDVGELPEVGVSLKQVYTRLVTAFGAVLVPIL